MDSDWAMDTDELVKAMYSAVSRHRLDQFLDRYERSLTPQVAAAIEQDFTNAAEFGDVVAATVSATAGRHVHEALGHPARAALLEWRFLRLRRDGSAGETELAELRTAALAAAARADRGGDRVGTWRLWLLAASCAARAAETTSGVDPRSSLATAVRDLADVGELIGESAVGQRPDEVLREFMVLAATVGSSALATEWSDADALPSRVAVRRLAWASERILPQSLLRAMSSVDPGYAADLGLRLKRLMAAGND